MIDFTNLPRKNKTYGGANGGKISVVYNGEQYMLKFPFPPTRNKEMSYSNGCVSEYIGCHVFALLGIPVQDTILGVYNTNSKQKIVVACKDFTKSGVVLQDFASLKILSLILNTMAMAQNLMTFCIRLTSRQPLIRSS